MRLVMLSDPPAEVEQWLDRRRAQGLDPFDEVWEGEYHVALAPHRRHGEVEVQLARILGPYPDGAGLIGSGSEAGPATSDNRTTTGWPDQAYFETSAESSGAFQPGASLVVEIVSPGDESREKFGFYARAGVGEVLIVDPACARVEWFVRIGSRFEPASRSALLALSTIDLQAMVRWPE